MARIRLARGVELMLDRHLSAEVAANRALTLGGSRYLLVEFTRMAASNAVARAVSNIVGLGLVPLLAHPERYAEARERPRFLDELRDRGVILQITSGALLGDMGSGEQKLCRRWIKEGRVHVIASDSHSPSRRAPGLTAAYREASKLVGESDAEKLVESVPRAIVEGRDLE